jgi:glutaredoxin 3
MEEMIKLSGGKRSVPQIFFGDIHIGGSDDLYNMNIEGKLDKLISDMKK